MKPNYAIVILNGTSLTHPVKSVVGPLTEHEALTKWFTEHGWEPEDFENQFPCRWIRGNEHAVVVNLYDVHSVS